FAIALWDGARRKLVLARDRLGKKPLYYALGQGSSWTASPEGAATRAVFGSELKTFAAHGGVPRELDHEALAQYLAVEYVPAPRATRNRCRRFPSASPRRVSTKRLTPSSLRSGSERGTRRSASRARLPRSVARGGRFARRTVRRPELPSHPAPFPLHAAHRES